MNIHIDWKWFDDQIIPDVTPLLFNAVTIHMVSKFFWPVLFLLLLVKDMNIHIELKCLRNQVLMVLLLYAVKIHRH